MNVEVARRDLSQVRVDFSAASALTEGQARVQVESFAQSTNNITYAVYGDVASYWEAFPAAGGSAGVGPCPGVGVR